MRCEKPKPFDCGAEPTCCKRCTHKYQENFNKDEHFPLVCQETTSWCSPAVSPASQQSMLHHDILIGYDKGTSTQTWFLGEKDFKLQEFLRKSPSKGGHQSKKVKGISFLRVLLACGGYGNEVHCKQK